jgi:predicted dehydrogenase
MEEETRMLRVAFIGAGSRARAAHYPTVARLPDVSIEAVAELDAARMATVAEKYRIPRQFTDYRKMLAEVELDALYVIMGPRLVAPIVIDCVNAGKHVFLEKPPGATTAEAEAMAAAAEASGVKTMVGLQRRFAAVTREAMRRVAERGPATLVLGEFHKNLLNARTPAYGVSTLWDDVIHVVDLIRYMSGGEATEVTAYQDRIGVDWRNSYNGMIRFDNNAVGFITGNRSSGGRYLRAEIHGIGIGCYMMVPDTLEILADNQPVIRLTGAELVGTEDEPSYEGILATHQHFVECIREDREPIASVRDVVKTCRLVDRLEGEQ